MLIILYQKCTVICCAKKNAVDNTAQHELTRADSKVEHCSRIIPVQ